MHIFQEQWLNEAALLCRISLLPLAHSFPQRAGRNLKSKEGESYLHLEGCHLCRYLHSCCRDHRGSTAACCLAPRWGPSTCGRCACSRCITAHGGAVPFVGMAISPCHCLPFQGKPGFAKQFNRFHHRGVPAQLQQGIWGMDLGKTTRAGSQESRFSARKNVMEKIQLSNLWKVHGKSIYESIISQRENYFYLAEVEGNRSLLLAHHLQKNTFSLQCALQDILVMCVCIKLHILLIMTIKKQIFKVKIKQNIHMT